MTWEKERIALRGTKDVLQGTLEIQDFPPQIQCYLDALFALAHAYKGKEIRMTNFKLKNARKVKIGGSNFYLKLRQRHFVKNKADRYTLVKMEF